MSQSNEKPACTDRVEHVQESDLPLCCPRPDQGVWNAHPRVYLAVEKTGEVSCPYCGTHYLLAQSERA